jgi:hypothetical protein
VRVIIVIVLLLNSKQTCGKSTLKFVEKITRIKRSKKHSHSKHQLLNALSYNFKHVLIPVLPKSDRNDVQGLPLVLKSGFSNEKYWLHIFACHRLAFMPPSWIS